MSPPQIGDLKWTVVDITPDELWFFEDKAVSYGFEPSVCCVCKEEIDTSAPGFDYVAQWSTQLVPLYGWIETPECLFGHRACLLAARKPRPIMDMPELHCSKCGVKLTDTRFSINDEDFCSGKCAGIHRIKAAFS